MCNYHGTVYYIGLYEYSWQVYSLELTCFLDNCSLLISSDRNTGISRGYNYLPLEISNDFSALYFLVCISLPLYSNLFFSSNV